MDSTTKEQKQQPCSSSSSSSSSSSFEYEFGGPLGTFMTTMLLPIVVLLLDYWSEIGYMDCDWNNIQQYWNWNCIPSLSILLYCTSILVGWFVFQMVLERLLPCEYVQGLPLPNHNNNTTNKNKNKNKNNTKTTTTTTSSSTSTSSSSSGHRLTYRINGHLAFWVTTLVLLLGGTQIQITTTTTTTTSTSSTTMVTVIPQLLRLDEIIIPHYTCFAFVSIVLCFSLSLYLYICSFWDPSSTKLLAQGGNSGNPIYDFFMGRELNPRIAEPFPSTIPSIQSQQQQPGFDWKQFCELRPGLMLWMILNLAYAQGQYQQLGYISGSMIMVTIFQAFYVWDALYQEKAILSTMDITTDGFGFMLIFGDLCWVPFTYSLQTKYLYIHDPQLSPGILIIIVTIHMIGYYIFRSANSQKDTFRTNPYHPSVQSLQFLSTKRGTKLLISGWWGYARKINYTGDYMIGLSWCCFCGFYSIVPYYYAIYFCILLIHRSIRDDHICQIKYGSDWDTYKSHVPYRFIPGII